MRQSENLWKWFSKDKMTKSWQASYFHWSRPHTLVLSYLQFPSSETSESLCWDDRLRYVCNRDWLLLKSLLSWDWINDTPELSLRLREPCVLSVIGRWLKIVSSDWKQCHVQYSGMQSNTTTNHRRRLPKRWVSTLLALLNINTVTKVHSSVVVLDYDTGVNVKSKTTLWSEMLVKDEHIDLLFTTLSIIILGVPGVKQQGGAVAVQWWYISFNKQFTNTFVWISSPHIKKVVGVCSPGACVGSLASFHRLKTCTQCG